MEKSVFEQMMDGLNEAIEIASGKRPEADYRVHVPADVNVKDIRKRQRLSQRAFAERYGFSYARIRDWEQGRSPIDKPSRILLTIIDKEPETVDRVLQRDFR
jgi:putative transcriptional regulator